MNQTHPHCKWFAITSIIFSVLFLNGFPMHQNMDIALRRCRPANDIPLFLIQVLLCCQKCSKEEPGIARDMCCIFGMYYRQILRIRTCRQDKALLLPWVRSRRNFSLWRSKISVIRCWSLPAKRCFAIHSSRTRLYSRAHHSMLA